MHTQSLCPNQEGCKGIQNSKGNREAFGRFVTKTSLNIPTSTWVRVLQGVQTLVASEKRQKKSANGRQQQGHPCVSAAAHSQAAQGPVVRPQTQQSCRATAQREVTPSTCIQGFMCSIQALIQLLETKHTLSNPEKTHTSLEKDKMIG